MIKAGELLDYARGRALLGDTGYDSNEFRREVRSRELEPVIHSKPERKRALPLNRKLYRKRYLVEIFFHNLKRFRAIATRYEKTARNYLAWSRSPAPSCGSAEPCAVSEVAGGARGWTAPPRRTKPH
jgi:transposase